MKNLTSIAEHSDRLEQNYTSKIEKWDLHLRRLEFGKQPLELWMFVPCKLVDGVWVVLYKPNLCNYHIDEEGSRLYNLRLLEWKQAKERRLFEGFEKDNSFVTHKSHSSFFYPISSLNELIVEDIVKYNLQLTPNSQKQIGL